MNSKDIVIRTERTLEDVIYEINGKIDSLAEVLRSQQEQLNGIKAEQRVINGRLNSLEDRLSTMQYTLNFAVTAWSLLLVALPLLWGLRKLFAFSIKDEIRRAVAEALDARS